MARIVVNKHFDNSANITADKFVNKGELVISNEPGYEGLYILNKNGEVIKIGQYSGGTSEGGNLSEDVKAFLKKYYMTSAQTVDYVEEFSGNVVTALENFSGGSQSDWNETDAEKPSYIQNKPDIQAISAEEVAKIVANAPEQFDTLKEIADWIENDTTGAAAMANDIKALKESAHTHSNKEVLDGIEKNNIDSWNTAEQKSKDYADRIVADLKNYVESLVGKEKSDHVALTESQYTELVANGKVAIDGKLIEYNDFTYYCVYEDSTTGNTSGSTDVTVDGEDLTFDANDVVYDESTGLFEIKNASIDENGNLIFTKSSGGSTNTTIDENNNLEVDKNNEIDTNGILSLGKAVVDENNILIF